MTTGEVQAKVKGYEELIQKARMMVVRAETQMQTLEAERTKLLKEVTEMGLTEETLPAEIERLTTDIDKSVSQLDVWAADLKAVLG